MEGILGYTEVESAYQALKDTNLLKGLYLVVSAIAVIITIRKVLKKYWDGITNGKPTDVKKYFELLSPLIPYVLVITAFPFIISIVEAVFSYMETEFLSNIGSNPTVDFEAWIKKEEVLYINNLNEMSSLYDPVGTAIFKLSNSLRLYLVCPIMLVIDNYLFSTSLAGRYVYLLLLEMAAPIAIVGLLYEKTESMFFSWVRNMFVCYMLIPGFMIANYFAESLIKILSNTNDLGFFMMLFLIALKIYLYKKVIEYIPRLIS